MDEILVDLNSLGEVGVNDVEALVTGVKSGDYKAVLGSDFAKQILGRDTGEWLPRIREGLRSVLEEGISKTNHEEKRRRHISAALVGLSAFNAFLQANVTGPPLAFNVRNVILGEEVRADERRKVRKECLDSLEVDGVSVYQLIPEVELFCLAKTIFLYSSSQTDSKDISRWMRIRINAFHQRLLTAAGKIHDTGLELQASVESDLKALEEEVLGTNSKFGTNVKVQFLLERAQIYIMQGMDLKARNEVGRASDVSGVKYLLSGALGKKTKFQEKDISQLVVFAKSCEEDVDSSPEENKVLDGSLPVTLDLNDDTLLESIDFATSKDGVELQELPAELRGISPENKPQLKPLDQIILLTEATIKDKFLPLDKLNREEILPFATRVLADKPTNYQIYTQALLVRSRIESHRSRTQERSVLQLQAIVDQIIADTEGNESEQAANNGAGIPEIKITSFLPKAKVEESAPVTERIKYIHQLHTPTRWEVESELAYAWSNAGSLVSALEIFKRLELWAEVALCYYSVGQEDKARQIIRRQLFYSQKGPEIDNFSVDASEVVTEKWDGEVRSPAPPHAPRLWCILGDLDQDPTCWERAWDISNKRFARAQRTLGEYYTKKGDLEKARDAYLDATVVNRQNNETWSRLGDIDLKVGNWDGAIIAFQQSIMIDDSDAKTYSNLGSALLSKHTEMAQLAKLEHEVRKNDEDGVDIDEDDLDLEKTKKEQKKGPDAKDILRQALIAYKKGASLAHDNWKIWDNVITIAGRMSPPSYPEILQAMSAIVRIRSPSVGELAVDMDILRALIGEVTSRERPINSTSDPESDIYLPPRGTLPRAVIDMVERDIIPLITTRSELWSLIEKLAIYRQDYAGALSCAEKAWRVATAGEKWLEDKEMWAGVANATDGLAAALESYGPMEKKGGGEVEKGWKMKARSAVRGVMGKARGIWDETDEFAMLEARLEELKGK